MQDKLKQTIHLKLKDDLSLVIYRQKILPSVARQIGQFSSKMTIQMFPWNFKEKMLTLRARSKRARSELKRTRGRVPFHNSTIRRVIHPVVRN